MGGERCYIASICVSAARLRASSQEASGCDQSNADLRSRSRHAWGQHEEVQLVVAETCDRSVSDLRTKPFYADVECQARVGRNVDLPGTNQARGHASVVEVCVRAHEQDDGAARHQVQNDDCLDVVWTTGRQKLRNGDRGVCED